VKAALIWVPVFVGVGQRVSGDAPANSNVVQLGLNRSQASFDVPKTFSAGQLGEVHAIEEPFDLLGFG